MDARGRNGKFGILRSTALGLVGVLICLPSLLGCGSGSSSPPSPDPPGPSDPSDPNTFIRYYWPNDPLQLFAPDAETGDSFGASVDISGDYAIVGAPNEMARDNLESNGQILDAGNAGAAYIYERQSDGTWDGGTKLVNPDGRSINDYFGNAVAIDGATALVGAYRRQGLGSSFDNIDQGAAYVFERQGYGRWSHTATLTAPDAKADTQFGFSLDLKGDRAIVSTRGNTPVGTFAVPAAYVFEKTAGTWGAPTKLIGQDTPYWDLFGWSVAIDGDYAVVGAPYARGGTAYTLDHAGVVYVFQHDGDTWDEGTKLVALDAEEADDLGRSVAISGQWVLAGASYKTLGDANGPWPGAAYFFYKPANGVWEPGQRVLAPATQSDSEFGGSVAIDNNYAVVGAPGKCLLPCQGAIDIDGSAYVYEQANGTWDWLEEEFTNVIPEVYDRFAGSIAISNDTIIAGNALFTDAAGAPGSAYIYNRTPKAQP